MPEIDDSISRIGGPMEVKIASKGRRYLESFNLTGVTLQDNFLRNQYKQVRDFYFSLPNDSLLQGFRARAGFPAPGASLGGWYGRDFFNSFGQLLSAFSRMYCATEDEEIKEKVVYIMQEWGRTVEPDGFFFYSRNPNAPHYFYDKMVGGLVDVYQYTGNEDALTYLQKITQWARRHLDRTNKYAHCFGVGSTEWYTLPENLFRAYVLTGDEQYRILGSDFLYHDYYRFYEKNDYLGLMRAGRNSEWHRYHAYSHVNTLSSAAMAYWVSGDHIYLKVLKNAYDMLQNTQVFNTGGFGPVETFTFPGQRTESLYAEDFHFESPCGSWAVFKLCRYLMEFTGSAFYGEWPEMVLYNGIGASLPVKPNGEVMYFSNYHINGGYKGSCNPWSCCTGTFPLDVAEYHNQIYYKSVEGIYVDLYVASQANWEKEGNRITLKQVTDFPLSDRSSFSLSMEKPIRFLLAFRQPSWCKSELLIKINGKNADAYSQNGWRKIERVWNDGDTVDISFPMQLRSVYLEKDQAYPVAFSYGPVILVSHGDVRPAFTQKELNQIDEMLVRDKSDSLRFSGKSRSNAGIAFKPFYEMGEGEQYFMYFDPYNIRVSHQFLAYGPDRSFWSVEGLGHEGMGDITLRIQAHISQKQGAYFKHTFHGTGIRWIGNQLVNGGMADIYIDGSLVDRVDQYGPVTGIPWMWEKKALDEGEHTLRVEVPNEKNLNSKGYSVSVKHLTVL